MTRPFYIVRMNTMRAFTTALALLVFLFGVVTSVHGQVRDVREVRDILPSVVRPDSATTEQTRDRTDLEARRQQLEETARARREEARKEAEARLKTAREEAQQKREEVKQRIAEHRAEQLKKLVARLIERLNALVDRLEALANKVQEHIDKFAEQGADTAAAQTQLDGARAKLAEARGQIAALDGISTDLVNSPNPRDFFAAVKDQILLIKETLREAHKSLASSLGELRGLSSVERETGAETRTETEVAE